MRTEEELKSILNSHTVFTLKNEISKANIYGFDKMKKAELIRVMVEKAERFQHITMNTRATRQKGVVNPRPKRIIPTVRKLGERKTKSVATKVKKGVKAIISRNTARTSEKIKEKVKEETKDVVPVTKAKRIYKKREGKPRGKYATKKAAAE